jgi:hypothetical protein
VHTLEPFWNWRHLYTVEEDERSPFHAVEHSEISFAHAVYDHVIHPQWESFGSATLYLKIIFAEYEAGYAVLELIGEWNDLLHNDIMFLKREVVEPLMTEGIHKFVLVGENVLNFHASDDCYYQEWWEEADDRNGWIALLNFREHVLAEMETAGLDGYFLLGGALNALEWRTWQPEDLLQRVEAFVQRRLGPATDAP